MFYSIRLYQNTLQGYNVSFFNTIKNGLASSVCIPWGSKFIILTGDELSANELFLELQDENTKQSVVCVADLLTQ